MTRKIKFRAWIEETWNETDDYVEPMTIQQMIHSKESTFSLEQLNDLVDFEQFTGLTDANGKEIYEGDIVKFFGANKKIKVKNEFGIIVYKADRYGAGFNSIIQNKEHGYGGINIAQDIVVGNVHENPELLEGKQ
ncbi:YopX family protein [Lacticaseibacillus paracasei]|uniref:YopX protein n=1 Tax=Lacticaseibacillus paracasei TaxID=1597 RepID=A0A422M309_LACPA|nr:YopX family protein [Lacticaseibacillus paracasei]RND81473.1 YopX protein [Lacticaseibacillus paracasei]